MTLRFAFAFALAASTAACARQVAVQTAPVVPTPITHTADLKALVEVAGQYTLVTVDGHVLPFATTNVGLTADQVIPEIASSSLLLRGDGTFALVLTYRKVVNGVEQLTDRSFTGTCTGTGPTYHLALEGAGITDVTLVGDKLYMDNQGVQFSYERRR
jgi:hypothetical protein